jgi:4-amino-4-deoxy-L-arabinose transferase-like glycosyltransferase
MNLYMSQGIGNEPTAALFSSSALVAALSLVNSFGWHHVRQVAIVTGFFLGLALLTKVSAVLLVFPILLFFILCIKSSRLPPFSKAKAITIYLLTISALAGWYYFRNYLKLGRVFMGGWDQNRTIVWWQDPGYRTLGQLARFGDSLRQPIYSACTGFWDGLYSTFWADGYLSSIVQYEYRPPWNYDFMLSGVLFSLVPMIGIVLGVATVITRRSREERLPLLLASSCILIFIMAMLYIYVTVPIYSTVKASYTLGLLVCYAVLGAAGFDLLLRGRIMRALVYGLLGCWGFSSYFSYFVR